MKAPRLIVVVGSPGSGKDILIRAIHDLGHWHAQVVPKHTTRARNSDDGSEMICIDDPGFCLESCDIKYQNYGNSYGIESSKIWDGLSAGIFQVVVLSDVKSIDKLFKTFGELVVLVYVHSELNSDEYYKRELELGKAEEYLSSRKISYRHAYIIYLDNYLAFDHVLLYTGTAEDLIDQIFRLIRAYEMGILA